MKVQLVLFGAGLLGMAGTAFSRASLRVGALGQWCMKKQGEILHAEFFSEPERAEPH